MLGLVFTLSTALFLYWEGYKSGFKACNSRWDDIASKVAARIKKEGIEIVTETQLQELKKFSDSDLDEKWSGKLH